MRDISQAVESMSQQRGARGTFVRQEEMGERATRCIERKLVAVRWRDAEEDMGQGDDDIDSC